MQSIALKVFLADKTKLPPVRDSLRLYRGTARIMFGNIFSAMAAGASVREARDDESSLSVIPHTDKAKVILAMAFDKVKSFQFGPYKTEGQPDTLRVEMDLFKAPAYELRDYVLQTVCPSWKAFVWDSLRAKTWNFWIAKDPEFQNSSRGWLTLNGARRLASCAGIGLEFPRATAKPRLEGHSIFLHWDKNIGEIEFHLPALDPGRWRVWKHIRDGEWKSGTVTLNERDGEWRIYLPYQAPMRNCDLDAETTLAVTWHDEEESFLRMQTGSDVESLSAVSCIDKLRELAGAMQVRERRRAACGSAVRKWGDKTIFKAEQNKVHNLTVHRENVVDTWCHDWSIKIVDCARRKRCSHIQLAAPPESLFGLQFQFAKLKTYVEYKAKRQGMTLA